MRSEEVNTCQSGRNEVDGTDPTSLPCELLGEEDGPPRTSLSRRHTPSRGLD